MNLAISRGRRLITCWIPRAIGVIGLVLGLAWAVESLRVNPVWMATQTAIHTRGEPLTFAELLGPSPASQKNFAESPLVVGLHTYLRTNDAKGRRRHLWLGGQKLEESKEAFSFPNASTPKGSKTEKRPLRNGVDLDGLAAVLRAGTNTRSKQVTDPVSGTVTQITTLYNLPKPNSLLSSAQAVLFALQARRDVLDRLVVDTQLPVCRYAIRYDDASLALLPHLSLHKTMAQLLRIRAIARINAGESNGANEDVLALFRLADLTGSEPTLISYLVSVAIHSIGLGAFHEGISLHVWTESQLAVFQQVFDSQRQRDGLVGALRGERLFGGLLSESVIAGDLDIFEAGLSGDSSSGSFSPLTLFPAFFWRQNQVAYAITLDRITALVQQSNPSRGLLAQDTNEAIDRLIKERLSGFALYQVFNKMLLPALGKVSSRSDRMLTADRLAVTVCALERYRLAMGTYPESLVALTPRWMNSVPLDPMDGQPLRYQLQSGGDLRLYSVGANKSDDGGIGDSATGRKSTEQELLDWVWPLAGAADERRLF